MLMIYLKISSEEKTDCFEIFVDDNGPGFDKKAAPSGESTHIGMENVRERVHVMCGGTVDVDSEIGVGTRVTVRIPKGPETDLK